MPQSSIPASLLRALAEVFQAHGFRWYLFGAQAATIWGRPRLTTDVDVTVDLGKNDQALLVAALQQAGFRLAHAFSDDFVRVTRVLPLVHEHSRMPLDIVLAGPGLEAQFLKRAVAVSLEDFVVPVISAEGDLLVTKILAGREKDLEDIRGILQMRADQLDVDYVRRTLEAVELALGQSDLRPLFERELNRRRPRK